jgi:hypothetical protein
MTLLTPWIDNFQSNTGAARHVLPDYLNNGPNWMNGAEIFRIFRRTSVNKKGKIYWILQIHSNSDDQNDQCIYFDPSKYDLRAVKKAADKLLAKQFVLSSETDYQKLQLLY